MCALKFEEWFECPCCGKRVNREGLRCYVYVDGAGIGEEMKIGGRWLEVAVFCKYCEDDEPDSWKEKRMALLIGDHAVDACAQWWLKEEKWAEPDEMELAKDYLERKDEEEAQHEQEKV